MINGVGVTPGALRDKPPFDLTRRPCPTLTTHGVGFNGQVESAIALSTADTYPPPPAPAPARPSHGLVAAGTFSGAGGSSTGWHHAGWSIPVAVEFVPAAAAAYRANHPTTTVIERDIRTVTGDELVAAAGGHIDVLEGSPPCTAFSAMGSGHRGWHREHNTQGISQRSDDLLGEWLRLVSEVRPAAFAAENVPRLAAGPSRAFFDALRHALVELGYTFDAAVLTAADYGVPQDRRRLFMVGFLDPAAGERFTWPAPTAPVRSAAPHLAAAVMLPDDPPPRPTAGWIERARARLAWAARGDWWCRAHLEELQEAPRPMNVAELRAVAGFPGDYVLGEQHMECWSRAGNCVPPPMASVVAQAVAGALGH